MTNKLKCPFCGAELERFQNCARCNTENCVAGFDPMPNQVWQALIDGKKAQDALNWVNEYLSEDKVEENVAVSYQYLKAKITSIMKGKDNE